MEESNSVQSIQCTTCQKHFTNKYGLKRHQIRVHLKLRYHDCIFCDSKFAARGDMFDHLLRHIGETPIYCAICGKGFPSQTARKVHEQIHDIRRSKKFECTFCKKRFFKMVELKCHLIRHEENSTSLKNMNKKVYSCVFCENYFPTKQAQCDHILRHVGEKPFPCKSCSRSFASSSEIHAHRRHAHEDDLPRHKCKFCESIFINIENLNYHISRRHANNRLNVKIKRDYKCNICSKNFSSKRSLNGHMTIHSKETPFKCTLCSKRFRLQSTLSTHIKSHLKEKPFKCKHCRKSFTRSFSLTNHVKNVHEQLTKFDCLFCDKKLFSGYERHIMKHIHEKPYHCKICGMELMTRLSKHKRMHNREQIFSCGVCSKKFHQYSSVDRHHLRHFCEMTENEWKCSICEEICESAKKIFKHLRAMHKNCTYGNFRQ